MEHRTMSARTAPEVVSFNDRGETSTLTDPNDVYLLIGFEVASQNAIASF